MNFLRLHRNESQGSEEQIFSHFSDVNFVQNLGLYPDLTSVTKMISDLENVAPEQILITCGAEDGVRRLIFHFSKVYETARCTSPIFELIEILLHNSFKKVESINWFLSPFDEKLSYFKYFTGLIFLVSPCNPTGQEISIDHLRLICSSSPNSFVVVDNVYGTFSDININILLAEFPNIAIIKSLSKSLGYPGLRLGYVMARPSVLNAIKIYGPTNPLSTLTKNFCDALKPELKTRIQKQVTAVTKMRNKMLELLSQHKIEATDTKCNFVLVKPQLESLFRNTFDLHKILIKEFSNDHTLASCVRISVVEENYFPIFLNALEAYSSQLLVSLK